MRIRWSNRLEIVDAHLRAKNLRKAKKWAAEILNDEVAEFYLSEEELEYLSLVLKLPRMKDWKRPDPQQP